MRELVTGRISLESPECSESFRQSVDVSYFEGGTGRCVEIARTSATGGEIIATLRWPTGLDLDLVLSDGNGFNYRQSIAANRSNENVRFVINPGTSYVFVVYNRGVDPFQRARFTGEIAANFTLEIERPE